MNRKIFKGLFCALLCVLLSVGQASALDFEGIGGATPNFGEVKEKDKEEITNGTPFAETLEEKLKFTPVELKDSTKDFFATLDGDVTLTLISGQKDFVDGSYVEYFNDFSADDKGYYYSFINTLKTISELNEYVKLQFVDPFDTASYDFMDEYSKYDLKYGDLFVTCYSNFDGSPTTRRTSIELKSLFKTEKDKKGNNKITGLNIEKVLVKKLESLRHFRNINVAYISDLCDEVNVENLKAYIKGDKYSFESIPLKDERLNGYDMIFIASPTRDVTLEEIVLLNTFLDNGEKTLVYFCPEKYVKLPNLHSFLRRWGIEVEAKYKLVCDNENGYFVKNTQLVAASTGSEFTTAADAEGGKYVMDNCTPLEIIGAGDIEVKTILTTKSRKATALLKDKQKEGELTEGSAGEYPLITLSQKKNRKKVPSSVVTFASVDFITSYLALQNPKTDKAYRGDLNGNLKFTAELIEKLNKHHRGEESGLGKYAVSLSEMGYDTTSGLKTQYILNVAIISVAMFIVIFVGLLLLFARRLDKKTKNIKSEEK